MKILRIVKRLKEVGKQSKSMGEIEEQKVVSEIHVFSKAFTAIIYVMRTVTPLRGVFRSLSNI